MATETETVELSTETTDDQALADAQSKISEFLAGVAEEPQKSPEQEPPATEEKPQETETTPETETETPPAAETEEELALPPEVQESVNKRMAQLTAKRKEAEEALAKIQAERDELDAKVKELAETAKEPAPSLPPDADPILRVPEINKIYQNEQKVEGARREATQLLRTSKTNPDLVLEKLQKDLPQQGFTDIEQVKDFLENVKDTALMRLSELRSQRESAASRHIQRLEKEAEKFHDLAIKAYPDALDKKSKMGIRVAELSKRMPALLDPKIIPDGWQILTDLAAGQLARELRGTATAAAPKVQQPPKLTPTAKTAPLARPASGKPQDALRKRMVETGDLDDVAKFLSNSPVLT